MFLVQSKHNVKTNISEGRKLKSIHLYNYIHIKFDNVECVLWDKTQTGKPPYK